MKHFLLFFAVALVMASCSQNSLFEEEFESDVFTGQMIEGFSRTSIDGNKNVNWHADDMISIFIKTGYHHCYKVNEGAGTASATFKFDSQVASSSKFDCHYAIYPFDENYRISDDKKVSVDLTSWATQSYQEGTFESGKSVMTAKSTSLNLPFLNANSLIRVRLSAVVPGSYSISSISLSSSEALNGPGVIDLSVDEPIVTLTGTEDKYKSITLECAEPILLVEDAIDFYILVPAKTYNDLTVTISGTNEMEGSSFNWSVTRSVPCVRNKITTLPKKFDAVDFSGTLEGAKDAN